MYNKVFISLHVVVKYLYHTQCDNVLRNQMHCFSTVKYVCILQIGDSFL